MTERRIYEKRNLRKSKAGSQGHVISDDIQYEGKSAEFVQCSEPFELCRSGGTGARGGSSARGKDADGVAKAGSGGSWAVGIKLGEKNKRFISESAEMKMSTLEMKDSKIGI